MNDQVAHTAVGPEARVRALVEEVLRDTDLYLVELNLRGRSGSQVVDVYLDRDAGLDVDALAAVSQEVGFLLDAEGVIPGRYTLNVSSPGLDRPLLLPRQFKKHVNRPLRVRYRTGEEGAPREVTGELVRAGEEGIELAAAEGETLQVAYTDIVESKVQLPW